MALAVADADTIGTRIKKARMSKWLTQEELAELVGTSRSMVAQIESDRKDPSVLILMCLADIFEISTDYLLGRTHETTISDSNCLCSCCANFTERRLPNERR